MKNWPSKPYKSCHGLAAALCCSLVCWLLSALLGSSLLGCRSTAGPERNGGPSADVRPTATATRTAGRKSSALGSPADDPDTPEARRLRTRLVRQIEIFDKPWGDGQWDPRVLAAMGRVPRHLFMPGSSIVTAYQDVPQPIGHGQTISQPTIVALMTNALRLRGNEQVLEIGTGSGYQAAVLSLLVKRVLSIEIVAPLGRRARKRLAELGYHNVRVRIGDGYRGWPDRAPFDRVILTAAPPKMPQALIDQLKDGGIVVAPVGEADDQVLVRWTKRGGVLDKQRLGAVRFVPMVPAQ